MEQINIFKCEFKKKNFSLVIFFLIFRKDLTGNQRLTIKT